MRKERFRWESEKEKFSCNGEKERRSDDKTVISGDFGRKREGVHRDGVAGILADIRRRQQKGEGK